MAVVVGVTDHLSPVVGVRPMERVRPVVGAAGLEPATP